MRKSLSIVVSILMSHKNMIESIALLCCIIIQQVNSSKSYFNELNQKFESILDINIMTQLKNLILTSWFDLNIWF